MGGFHGTWLRTAETEDFTLTWTRFDPSITLVAHAHSGAYASLVLQGSYTEVHDCSPHWCVPGTAIVHRAGEVHADHFHERCVVLNVEPKCDDATAELFYRALRQFAPDLAVPITGERYRCESIPAWLREACDLLAGEGRATPGQAAALARKHPADFSRAFRRYVGSTPGSFQRRARIRQAVSLMMTSRVKLAQIAQDCGFSDQSHFTHAFVRETGMSPQRFATAFGC